MGLTRTIFVTIPTSLAVAAASTVAFTVPAEAATTKCKSVGDGMTVCNTITSKTVKRYKVKYADSVINKKNYAITGHCTSKVSKTTKYSVSISVSGEFKAWIFAKMSVTVSGGLEKSVTTEYGSSVDFKVKAKDTVNCDYGTYVYVVKGHETLRQGGKVIGKRNWTATAPKKNGWKVY